MQRTKKCVISGAMALILAFTMVIGGFGGALQVRAELEISKLVYDLTKTGEVKETTIDGTPVDSDKVVLEAVHATPNFMASFSYDVATETLVVNNANIIDEERPWTDTNNNGVIDSNQMVLYHAKGILGKGKSSLAGYWFLLEGLANKETSTLTVNLEPGAELTIMRAEVGNRKAAVADFTLGEGVKCELLSADEGNLKFTREAPKDGEAVKTEDGASYKIESAQQETVAFTAMPENGGEVADIPDEIELYGKKYKVTKIENGALKNNSKITSAKIGNNVETIGDSAFEGCSNLKSFKMGSKVKKIGKGAFKKCKKLTKATLSDSVTEIGAYAFNGDSKLGKFTIGKNVKKIGKGAIKNIKPTATIKIRGNKKQKAAIKKKVTKSSTGYKKTMKIK